MKKNNKIKLIIFDFDDTLVMTEEKGFHLENDVAKSMGFKPQTREMHMATWPKPLDIVANIRFPGIDIETFMVGIGKRMAEYTEKGKFDVLSEETETALKQLKTNGYELAVLTSRTEVEVRHILSKHPLLKYVPVSSFYYKERNKHRKPDPRVFEAILSDMKVEADKCVYVGDALTDALGAKLAGLRFVASLESKLRDRDEFNGYVVDAFVNKLSELPEKIQILEEEEQISLKKEMRIKLEYGDVSISVPHDYFIKKFPEISGVIDEIDRE
ncbi:HAD family hydrolase [Candidatus Dojkabacteria bacterium]|nr:HAD family hydrolase [Candidatus Dojkabacteria bacterium]